MPKKILFFTTGMTAGGAERVVATLANAFDARGFSVIIAMVKGDKSAYELAPNVELRSANLTPGIQNLPRAIAFYRRLIKQESPDIIASFSTKSDLIALFSKVLLGTRGKLIVSDRADPNTRDNLLQLACNVMYRWSDALVCQSQSVANYYWKRCPSARISVIPNPLNPQAIGEPHLTERAPHAISVGRLSDQKNHRLAIKAFQSIHRAFPNLTMKIFGAGPLESELRELIQAEGLDGQVTLEGIVPNVTRMNQDAALFLFTSNYEGYPNALLEAVATGIPAVTTDFSPGTANEIVEHGVNGYIVAAGDQAALEQAAIRALSGKLHPEHLAASARRVRDKHETERIVDSWLGLFSGR